MTHDPLCPFAQWDDEQCFQRDAGVLLCDLIAKVREDTLAAAVQRVEALRYGPQEMYEVADMYHAAIAAIKGDRP